MPDVVGQWSSQGRASNPIGIDEILWVSDKIRYDQSSIERVIDLPSPQNRWGPTLKRYLEEGLSKVITTTSKPIGAHSTSGCPFAMYQILSFLTFIFVCTWYESINSFSWALFSSCGTAIRKRFRGVQQGCHTWRCQRVKDRQDLLLYNLCEILWSHIKEKRTTGD